MIRMVANVQTCSSCHTAIPADAQTLGLCPRCLLKSALAGESRMEMDLPTSDELADLLPAFDNFELLGQGGMGIVFQARQKSLDRTVAIKFFPKQTARDPSFAQRFIAEARILASLTHPHIVTAYEFGESERFCHLVMEFVPGQSLRERLATGPLPRWDAIEIAQQICAALEYAHANGVIHRDIKPENILLQTQGNQKKGNPPPFAKVADFGLAKLTRQSSTDFTLTAAGRVLGTPDYMAPEQRDKNAVVDPRADIYALGVVLYEMLTGQLPIGKFDPPTNDNRLNRVILRCLESDREKRFVTIRELRQKLASLAQPAFRVGRFAMMAAIEAMVVVLIGLLVVLYVRSQKATPLATTQPAPIQTTRPTSQPGFVSAYPVSSGFRSSIPDSRFTHTPNDYFAKMERDFGRNRIVTIYIDDIPESQVEEIRNHLKEISGATSFFSMGSNNTQTIHLAPVRDIEGLAKKIDIGKVQGVDLQKRTIDLLIEHK